MTIELDLKALNHSPASTPAEASVRKSLFALSSTIAHSKRIIVVTGAGISCSSGIPDFRSSDGLYALVKERYPNVVLKGKDLFSASLFRDPSSTQVFYAFVASLKSSIDSAHPSATHRFIKNLDTKGKLLRSYTQNIDGLEERAGLAGTSASVPTGAKGKGKGKGLNTNNVRSVQLHGDIHRVRCTLCSAEYICEDEHLESFSQGEPLPCPECSSRSQARVSRSARPLPVGTLRPAIVLYDEIHPLGEEIGLMSSRDMARKPDLLIIMGTSLKVHGLKRLVKDFALSVRAAAISPSKPSTKSSLRTAMLGKVILVNKTPPPSDWSNIIDYWVKGDTDGWVTQCEAEWKKIRPKDWEVQTTLDGPSVLTNGTNSLLTMREDQPRPIFKVVKDLQSVAAKVGKPTKKANAENIPPPADLHDSSSSGFSSSPNFKHSRTKSEMSLSPATPTSPNKRRSSCEDLSMQMERTLDIQSDKPSPTKKTKFTSPSKQAGAILEERGLLFGRKATDADSSMMSLDGDDIIVIKAPPRKTRSSRQNQTTRSTRGDTVKDPIRIG